MSRSARRLVGAVVAALAMLLVSGLPPATAADDPAVVSKLIAPAAQDAALDHWTTARLKAAEPGDALLEGRSLADVTSEVVKGLPQVIPGTEGLGELLPGLLGFPGGVYPGGGEVVQTTGKVFFTLDGQDYQCSGSAVNSQNESLVLTAGHCLHEGPGSYVTNFVFIPAYDDGDRPHGTFAARALVTTEQWRTGGDLNFDLGFAVVAQAGGRSLVDTVGGQGIGFNQNRGQYMYAFGYPAASPYDGQRLAWCHGRAANDILGSDDLGMTCDMTGGSSGGPWFAGYDEETGIGILNSVNSFKYTVPLLSSRMWGPYFGADAQALYSTAQHL